MSFFVLFLVFFQPPTTPQQPPNKPPNNIQQQQQQPTHVKGLLDDKIPSNNYSPADFEGLALQKGELGPELKLLRKYNKRTKSWEIYFDDEEGVQPEDEESKADADADALVGRVPFSCLLACLLSYQRGGFFLVLFSLRA